MYSSFVRSSMDYASAIWVGTYKSDILKLEKIQIDGMRLITGATARSNISLLYNETNFTSIQQRAANSMLILMYKIRNGICPTYLSNLVHENEQRQHYNLRSNASLEIPFARLESFKRSFVPHTCSLWNALHIDIQNAASLDVFKQRLNMRNTTGNKLYYYGKRRPAIHHARLRIGCSKLNSDLFYNLHVIESAQCQCGFVTEDAFHFFFNCHLYDNERQDLLRAVTNITEPLLPTILFGNKDLTMEENQEVFHAVHNFIQITKRFE